jgi:hypothetical protein
LLNFSALHNLTDRHSKAEPDPRQYVLLPAVACLLSKSGAIVMPSDPVECRLLATRCAEFAATATTPQLKAWFSDLAMQWDTLAIAFAKFVENDVTREYLWRSLDEGKRLSK